jgi:hypothetical protein
VFRPNNSSRPVTMSKISSLINQINFGINLSGAGQMKRIQSRSDERKLDGYEAVSRWRVLDAGKGRISQTIFPTISDG